MLFKVTHIDEQGHRRKALVPARSWQDAADQMDRLYGDSRAGACMRMASKPVLHVVARGARVGSEFFMGDGSCGS